MKIDDAQEPDYITVKIANIGFVDEYGIASETQCFPNFVTVNNLAGSMPSQGLTLWIDAQQKSSFFQSENCIGDNPAHNQEFGCVLDLSKNSNHHLIHTLLILNTQMLEVLKSLWK